MPCQPDHQSVMDDYDALYAKHERLKSKADDLTGKVISFEYGNNVPFSKINKAKLFGPGEWA